MILLPFPRPLVVIDDNVPVDDKAHYMVRIRSPLEHQEGVEVSVVGTFNGIVLLVLINVSLRNSHMILYNPLTCASKMILEMDPPTFDYEPYVFGFDPNDLKVIRIGTFDIPNRNRFTCDVFDLKTSSWCRSHYLRREYCFWDNVGTFLNGVLYWVFSLFKNQILALNVKDMVFSKIKLPPGFFYVWASLSSINGCLSIINRIEARSFDVWVMKEQGVADSWLKTCSFTFGLDPNNSVNEFRPICILGNGKILITQFMNGSNQLVMYDKSNDSYETLNGLAGLDHLKLIHMIDDLINMYSIEYVESLVSPSDICFI